MKMKSKYIKFIIRDFLYFWVFLFTRKMKVFFIVNYKLKYALICLFFFLLYSFSLKLLFFTWHWISLIVTFNDPVTAFCYHLISLHNDIIWFILIILGVVYWSLYKIIKEFNWSVFNKQGGGLKYFYFFPSIFKIQVYIFSFLFNIWKKGLNYYYKLINFLIIFFYKVKFSKNPLIRDIFVVCKDKYQLFFGLEFFKGIVFPKHILSWKFVNINQKFQEKYLQYRLFTYSINARYFYNGKKSMLHIFKYNHSLYLEYIFAFFPTAIILWILIPSFYLLYSLDDESYPYLTVKVIGHQWFWNYEIDQFYNFKERYIKYNSITFDSVLIQEEDLMLGDKRLLSVNNPLIIPTAATIKFVITSSDVLHAWSIPEFGLKIDAVPGRLNQFITMICKPGIYYGQCSELCGIGHGFMPIVVEVVHPNNFKAYLNYENFILNGVTMDFLQKTVFWKKENILEKFNLPENITAEDVQFLFKKKD